MRGIQKSASDSAVRSSDGVCATTPISFGQTINGTLSPSDCPLSDGSVLDAYSFSGTAGQRISVSMSSTAFDTYLYLLNPDGSELAINDDAQGTNSRIPISGSITLPTTGTYTILANSFWPIGNPEGQPATGAYSLTLTLTVQRTLTVAADNAGSSVTIPVSPTDNDGKTSGMSQFTVRYDHGTGVNLFAPGTAPNGNIFQKWLRNGVEMVGQPQTVLVFADNDYTMTAVYGPPPVHALTVESLNPDSGVDITVSPIDTGGMTNGTTRFIRNYQVNTSVTLKAPATVAGGNIFQRWQRDGFNYSTDSSITFSIDGPRTMTAVYAPPTIFTLTVSSSNPNSGTTITVTPNDNNGVGDGTTQFTRTYLQNQVVTLTAPEAAPNGNKFDKWLINGNTWSFTRTTTVTMNQFVPNAPNINLTAAFVTTPNLILEAGTNNVGAVNSVTFLRGPFQILDSHNFSTDGHTRIIIFTSDLGITESDPPPVVLVNGNIGLPVERAGPLTGVPGLTGTYIVVKLPNELPPAPADLQLSVLFRGVTGNTAILKIIP